MANERTAITERLLDVLESIRAQQQSGRLIIGQYNGGRMQEGEVYIQAGQPVYARLAQLAGQEALNRLLSWRNISITFYLEEAVQVTTQPGSAITTGRQVAALPQRSSASSQASVSTAVPDSPGPSEPPALTPVPSPSGEKSYMPGLEWLVPRKSAVERDVMTLPLTRPQRFTYFLVDGRRTVADLSRCTGKTVQELDLILSELRAQGLVEI